MHFILFILIGRIAGALAGRVVGGVDRPRVSEAEGRSM
jgi:uncharacterized membrane protein YeaQ/YmgE (transglycosylase-associated protein family)